MLPPNIQFVREGEMYLRTVLATSAGIPFFAAFIAERDERVSEDLIAVAYFCAVGLPGLPHAARQEKRLIAVPIRRNL